MEYVHSFNPGARMGPYTDGHSTDHLVQLPLLTWNVKDYMFI